MTAYELIQCLAKVPADTPVKLFDHLQYRNNGFQFMDDCLVPLDEVVFNESQGVVIHSTWTGILFGDDDEEEKEEDE